MTWKAVSEAFGKTILNPTNKITINLRFPGQYYDQETGTHYNYFRDYNPNLGRYNESDPIGLDGGINPYGYVGANPFMYYDPYGLWSFSDAYFGTVNKILPDVVTDFLTNDTVVNSVAGFGDNLSLGLTKLGRDSFDIGSVDYCSNAYFYGEIASYAVFIQKTAANSALIADKILSAERVGSGLKADPMHRAASFLSKEQLQTGKTFFGKGGDGNPYTLHQTLGGFNGKNGVYEYMINSSGKVSHQRFIDGGKITGSVNQKVLKSNK